MARYEDASGGEEEEGMMKCNLQHVGSVSMKWLLLLDITQDIYRQFHYFTMVTSDQILEKDFFFFCWDKEENIFS